MDLDLENGGGGNNNDAVAVLTSPNPADPNTKEPQPCTWLRAAPYVAVMLAGVALLAGFVVLSHGSCAVVVGAGQDRQQPTANTAQCGWAVSVLAVVGVILMFIPVVMAYTALTAIMASDCCCCVPRLEADP